MEGRQACFQVYVDLIGAADEANCSRARAEAASRFLFGLDELLPERQPEVCLLYTSDAADDLVSV